MGKFQELKEEEKVYNYGHEGDAVVVLDSQLPEDRVVGSTAWLMERRLATLDNGGLPSNSEDKAVALTYWNKFTGTGDGYIWDNSGSIYIALDADFIAKNLYESNLPINDEDPTCFAKCVSLDNFELPKNGVFQFKDYSYHGLGTKISKADAYNDPILRILARHPDVVPKEYARDENLLKEYLDAHYALLDQMGGSGSQDHFGLQLTCFSRTYTRIGQNRIFLSNIDLGPIKIPSILAFASQLGPKGKFGVKKTELESTVNHSIARSSQEPLPTSIDDEESLPGNGGIDDLMAELNIFIQPANKDDVHRIISRYITESDK